MYLYGIFDEPVDSLGDVDEDAGSLGMEEDDASPRPTEFLAILIGKALTYSLA